MSRRGTAPPGRRSERRRSERRGKAVPQGRPGGLRGKRGERAGGARRRLDEGASDEGASDEGRRCLKGAPAACAGSVVSAPAGRGAAWTKERATRERATKEGGASRAPRRLAREARCA